MVNGATYGHCNKGVASFVQRLKESCNEALPALKIRGCTQFNMLLLTSRPRVEHSKGINIASGPVLIVALFASQHWRVGHDIEVWQLKMKRIAMFLNSDRVSAEPAFR